VELHHPNLKALVNCILAAQIRAGKGFRSLGSSHSAGTISGVRAIGIAIDSGGVLSAVAIFLVVTTIPVSGSIVGSTLGCRDSAATLIIDSSLTVRFKLSLGTTTSTVSSLKGTLTSSAVTALTVRNDRAAPCRRTAFRSSNGFLSGGSG
jgi:hypothetical protein